VELIVKNKSLLKNVSNGLIILIVTVFTYKFIMWNFWKLEEATAQAKKILEAPPAVNLILSKGNSVLFQKSFPYNVKGKYYIINHFDITPFIGDKLDLIMSVNKTNCDSFLLYRFKHFNIISFRDYCFVFTTRDCEMEEFLKLIDAMPRIMDSLPKLVAKGNQAPLDEYVLDEFIEARVVVDRSHTDLSYQ
jgi:hypothetical protein